MKSYKLRGKLIIPIIIFKLSPGKKINKLL